MAERPKRRKHKDNPYTLEVCEDRNIYRVYFRDGKGLNQCVEINETIFNALDRFELEDIVQLNEYDRHIEHSEVYEITLNKRAKDKPISIEDEIIRKASFEELKNAIERLPEIQKRRIKKYYFDDKTENEIAQEEKVSQKNVSKSLAIAKRNLKEILKNCN